jgi:hypothetical protein
LSTLPITLRVIVCQEDLKVLRLSTSLARFYKLKEAVLLV